VSLLGYIRGQVHAKMEKKDLLREREKKRERER
jgi:heme exporter protein D